MAAHCNKNLQIATFAQIRRLKIRYFANITFTVAFCCFLAFQFYFSYVIETEQHVDITKDILTENQHQFQFTLIDTTRCMREKPFILVIVHSATYNVAKRHLIRSTLGDPKFTKQLKIVVIFALGATRDPKEQQKIVLEFGRHQDIIQENFIDDYHNMTYKAVMWMRYAINFCEDAKYVLKIDDDTLAEPFHLVERLAYLHHFGLLRPHSCICWILDQHWRTVMRDPSVKHYVPRSLYPYTMYPNFCLGAAYVISMNLVRPMFEKALRKPYFWIDDVFVTGLLVKDVGGRHYNWESMFERFLRPDIKPRLEKRNVLFSVANKDSLIVHMWNVLLTINRQREIRAFNPVWHKKVNAHVTLYASRVSEVRLLDSERDSDFKLPQTYY